ncbi:MAG TPA: hypothetical protein VFM79_03915, partial [Pelobium sp.]|nr:hypothetical protein [Pelobium sp.]
MKITVYKQITLIMILGICFLKGYAQNQTELYMVKWPSDTVNFDVALVKNTIDYFPRIQPVFFGNLPSVFLKIPVNSFNNSVEIVLNESSNAVISKNRDITDTITNELQLTYFTSVQNKQPYLLISFLPIYKDANGSLRKVNSFRIAVNPLRLNAIGSTISSRTYQNNSVLSSGNWYKIAVKDEGVYKVDYSFLKKLGVDVDQLNPKNIRLYGNGGFMLPQKNSAPRTDDLTENAIEVIGEADGKFDSNDYLIFYNPGNTRWKLSSQQTFEHEQNVYTDSSYYFINVDKGPGKRVMQTLDPVQSPNYVSNSFDDYQLYEKDLYGLITENMKSGRDWYGEDFEFSNSRDFEFDVSGLLSTEPFLVKTKMAIRANSNSGAKVSINNQPLYNLSTNGLPLTYETDYARPVAGVNSVVGISGNVAKVNINYGKINSTSNAWLDYIEVNFKRSYTNSKNYLRFRDKSSVANGNVSQFNLGNLSADAKVWDVSDFTEPKSQKLTSLGGNRNFIATTSTLKEFVAFESSAFKIPDVVGKVENQDLHGLAQADFLIITAAQFFNEAKRLGELRKSTQGLSYHVVTTEQVFNE